MFKFTAVPATALALAFFSFGVAHGRADTITTFQASGTFESGSTLLGTLTIDTTAGVATAVDLIVSAPASLTFDFIQWQNANFPTPGDYTIQTGTAASGLPNLNVNLPVSSLIGYTGGSVASDTQPANGFVPDIYYSSTDQDRLSAGNLTAVPEPSAALLALGGLFALGLLHRKITE